MIYEEPEMIVTWFGKKDVVRTSTLDGKEFEDKNDGFDF